MPPKNSHLDNTKSNEMFNFYTHNKVKALMTQYENPHFNEHQISIPFRMGIVSASGGGKTVFALNLISKMSETWGHIYVVYKASEPLYEFMAKQIGEKNITFLQALRNFRL